MKILLAAATEAEIAPVLSVLKSNTPAFETTICITGVGICAATFGLSQALFSGNPGLVIVAGIAGSFDRSLPLGTVVQITRDCFGDLGAEDHDAFLELPQMGLAAEEDVCFQSDFPEILRKFSGNLPARAAITVQTATGSVLTAQRRLERFGPVLESMEGAAFHYVCQKLSVPLLHLRAVSNYAEARNRPSWDIPLAVKNLNEVLEEMLFGQRPPAH